MSRKDICTAAMALLFLAARGAPAEQITFTMTAGPYQIQETEEGFQRIDMFGFSLVGEPGKPRLPMCQYHFALPPGAQVTAVRIWGERDEILEGSYRIEPAPAVIPLNADPEAIRQSRHDWQSNYDATYLADDPFPERVGEDLGAGGLRKYTLLRVAYYPLAYRPLSGQLSLCRQATVEVDYRRPAPGTEADQKLRRSLGDTAGDERARELFDNPAQARRWYQPADGLPGTKSSYEYVIITTASLESAVADLVDWKEEVGFGVNVVTTGWISSNYSGSDLPEKIHNFLEDKYLDWGIEYVLLAGNIDVIPMRYCYPSGHSNAVPTDYYYADLTGDWDSDGDGYYGEPGQDAVDLLADVYVGRIPYSDSPTLAGICDKLVATESDTGSWKDNALLLGAFINFANEDHSGNPATDGAWVAELMSDYVFAGWGITTMYEKSGRTPSSFSCDFPLTKANVVGQWSANDYGVVAWTAHGSECDAWRKYWNSDDGDNVPESVEMAWTSFFGTGDVPSLDDDHPSIVFCSSCENGHPEEAHLARELIKNGSAGAIAATRVSYGIIGWTEPQDGGIESLLYYFYDYLVNRNQPVGAALYDSKYYCWRYNWQNSQNMYDFCLYGEPALRRQGMAPTPQVVVSEPQPNVYLASSVGNITATFDRPMDPATIVDTTMMAFGELRGRYPGTIAYDPDDFIVTLDPALDFLPGEPVWVQITSQMRSGAGTPVSGGYGWHFRPLTLGGSGIFEEDTTFGAGLDPSAICPGDFDADGWADLAVANLSLDNISLWINDGLGHFALGGTYAVGSDPRALAAGDLDGDGSLDLVAADSSAHQISVLLNNGDGTFGSHQTYGTSQRPEDVCVADLNGDGHLDVAAVCSHDDQVSVLLNDGHGSFAPATHYDVGDIPRAIAAGDVNGDGRMDLVTTNQGSDDVSVLINQGGGAFAAQATYAAGDGPHGLFAADLNVDGLLDLAVANTDIDRVSIMINSGSGVFSLDSSFAVGDRPLFIRMADMDGDEDGDLFAACAGADQASVLRNRGDATFESAAGFDVGDSPVSLCAVDLDGDGDADVAAANAGSNDVSVLLNFDALQVVATLPECHQTDIPAAEDLTVTLNSPVDESCLSDSIFIVCGSQTGRHWGSVELGADDSAVVLSPIAPFAPGEVVTSVLTRDLKSHIGIPMNNGYGWSFFVAAAGEGLFERDTSLAGGNAPQGITAADLDGDGLVDLATANYLASSVGVFFNHGDGTFGLDSLYHVATGPVHVCAMDLEGDGDLDLATANAWDYNVSVLRNDGGLFSVVATYSVGKSPYDICAADLDGDGDPDLAVSNAGDDDVSILFNGGAGTFTYQARYAAGNVPWGVRAGDVDADGDFDLVVANWSDRTFSVLANKGNGVFYAQQIYSVDEKPKIAALGELNGDGYLDVVFSGYEDDVIMVCLNQGDGSFASDSAYAVKNQPSWVSLADLDGDGDQDLAVSRAAKDSITVMINAGDGTFGQKKSYPAGDKPMGVCAVDADGDDALDLAISCYDGDQLVLRYNAGSTWPPAAIADLSAVLADSCIHLAWSAVTTDQMGNPLVVDHYTVYRQTDPFFIPVPGDSLGATTDTFFDDTTSALKDPGVNHYYVVKAVDLEGRKSVASVTVGEFDVILQEVPK